MGNMKRGNPCQSSQVWRNRPRFCLQISMFVFFYYATSVYSTSTYWERTYYVARTRNTVVKRATISLPCGLHSRQTDKAMLRQESKLLWRNRKQSDTLKCTGGTQEELLWRGNILGNIWMTWGSEKEDPAQSAFQAERTARTRAGRRKNELYIFKKQQDKRWAEWTRQGCKK